MPTTSKIDRAVPHSVEAERALLGSILLDNEALNVALETLASQDFFVRGHQLAFEKMQAMANQSRTVDLVTLVEELGRDGLLEKAGGAAYLASLTDGVPVGSVATVREYADIVVDKSLTRRVINACNNVTSRCLEGTDRADVLVDLAVAQFLEIGERDSGAARTYRQAAVDLLKKLAEGKLKRVFVGVGEVDKTVGGFLAGELVLYTAEPGVGKTFLAAQTRRRACRDGLHTLFASGEMDAEHLAAREIATGAKVEHWKMRQPEYLQREDWKALSAAATHQCERCKILDGELTMGRIAAAARRMKAEGGLDLLVIDYDELVEAPGANENEQLSAIARGAKGLAIRMEIPVIMISQLRKALSPEDRKNPTLARLYGSGAKQKHASIVLFVNRDWCVNFKGAETKAEIFILKSRDGRTGKKDCYFSLQSLTFADLEKSSEPQARGESKLDFKEEAAGGGNGE